MLRVPYIFRLVRHGYITDARISMGPIVKREARRVRLHLYIVPIYRRRLNKRIIMDKNTKKKKQKKKKKKNSQKKKK